MADNEVMEFEGGPNGRPRRPQGVYGQGKEPDPLYTLANERTYLAWLRLSLTLMAAAVAVDRLFVDHPWFGDQILSLGLVAVAFGALALGVFRWWASEQALRLRRPLPGFGVPLLATAALVLVACGVAVLILVPSP